MNFGSVTSLKNIDLKLPGDHRETSRVLGGKAAGRFNAYVGCAKWNRGDLKNFYPKGVKDELSYYATQFNSIELNATFYQPYEAAQFRLWREKTPDNFRFFPKIIQGVSHHKRLKDARSLTEKFCLNVSALEHKLGMLFLQMPENFKTKDFDRLELFVKQFPKGYPLAIELRNAEWFSDKLISEKVYQLFEKHDVTNVIVDTAGRRDMLHMRLTNRKAFIRYVGANHRSDYDRLEPWAKRIAAWRKLGLKEVYFFLHQNREEESPKLAAEFIKKLNALSGTKLPEPEIITAQKKSAKKTKPAAKKAKPVPVKKKKS